MLTSSLSNLLLSAVTVVTCETYINVRSEGYQPKTRVCSFLEYRGGRTISRTMMSRPNHSNHKPQGWLPHQRARNPAVRLHGNTISPPESLRPSGRRSCRWLYDFGNKVAESLQPRDTQLLLIIFFCHRLYNFGNKVTESVQPVSQNSDMLGNVLLSRHTLGGNTPFNIGELAVSMIKPMPRPVK